MKLAVGNTFPDFTVTTNERENVSLHSLINKKTVFWVLRYIGCPTCRYDVHELSLKYGRIAEKGYDLYVVMQSDVAHIRKELAEVTLPFEIICDNTLEIYKTLEINPAASKEELRGDHPEKLLAKRDKIIELGFKHGDYEGDELQLPALFIVDENCIVTCSHYGKDITDMPTVDELIEML